MLKRIGWHIRSAKVAARRIEALSKRLRDFQRANTDFEMTVPRRMRMRFAHDIGGTHDVALHWDEQDLIITMRYQTARNLHVTRVNQLFAAMVWFLKAGPDAEYMTLNISDGETASTARFAPSVFTADTIALPDQYFFDTKGFRDARALAQQSKLAWSDRTDEIVWRGGAVGTGITNATQELADHPAVIQRIRLAHLTKGTDADVRFVPVSATRREWELLLRSGLTGERIEEPTWIGRKFAIDIDGRTNTWSNLIIRMHYGCCVLKVASQFGYRQWYYDKLRPYESFVPVKADMSDLFDQIEWVKSNPKQAEEIARAGQRLVSEMTFESEAEFARQTILEHWRWPL